MEKDFETVRVSVSLSRALLKKVDAFAKVRHVSRSAVVTYALMVALSVSDESMLLRALLGEEDSTYECGEKVG